MRKTIEQIFWPKIHKTKTCWLWKAGISSSGYGMMGMPNKTGFTLQSHHASWIIHYGSIPKGLHVLHKCDIRLCVNPEHLFLGTHQDNMDDMIKKGRDRKLRGEDLSFSKLTEETVKEIRKSYVPRKVSLRFLAKKYNVGCRTIAAAISGFTWKHVPS